MYNQSESIKAIAPALLAAQSDMENPVKNKVNQHFKNTYADLATVLNVVRPALNEQKILLMQFPSVDGNTVSVETRFIHESGEYISNIVSGPCPKPDPQGIGIAITYYRRYGLTALIGLAQEDEDGNIPQAQTQAPGYNSPAKNKPRAPETKKPEITEAVQAEKPVIELGKIAQAVINRIKKQTDLKGFLLLFEELAGYQNQMPEQDFKCVWYELRLKGREMGLEWDKHEKIFISVDLPVKVDDQQQAATH